MPVYTVRTPTSTRNSWAEGLKSLADAFAPPDPKYGIMAAELGMKRDQMDFEQGMDRDRYALDEQRVGIAREEADANIARLSAAAELADLQGDTEAAQKLLYTAQQLKAEADTAAVTQKTDAGNAFKTLITSGDPSKLGETFGAAVLGDDIEADPAQIGAVLGMTPEELDAPVYAETGNYPNTLAGSREGLAAQMERQMAEPLTLSQNQQAIVPPEHQAYTPENKGRVGGLINVGENEQLTVPGAPGTEDTVYTGADYKAGTTAFKDYEPWGWVQDGKPFQVAARMDEFGVPRDMEGNELPANAIPIAKPQVTGPNLGGVLKATEAEAKTVDLVPQVITGVQDINDLVGYDAATDTFAEGGGKFPGPRSVFANMFGAGVESIFGKDLGTYAGNVSRGDFANDFEYQMFRISEPLLRFRSGAATPEEEVARYRLYGPMAGLSDEQNQRRIRDLNRMASAMAYVAQKRGLPIMDVVSYTSIIPGQGILDREMRMEVESAINAGLKPTVAAPEVPAAPAVPGAVVPEFRFD